MTRISCLLIVLTLVTVWCVAPASAESDDAIGFTGVYYNYTDACWTLGWEFSTNEEVTVTHLGFYDDYKNGLTQSHVVGIYNSSGTLLVSGTVYPGDPLSGWFRYMDVADTTLAAGQTYYVQAVTGSENYTWSVSGFTSHSAINVHKDAWYYPPNCTLSFPNRTDYWATGYYGPNFKIQTNQPPTADAGPDQIVPEESPLGTNVTLDGTGSSDPDGDPLTYQWDVDGDGYYNDATTGATPTVTLDLGPHVIGLRVSDGIESDTDTVTVTIVLGTAENQLYNLRQYIISAVGEGLIDPELGTALVAKVDAAIAALARGAKNSAKVAMNVLGALTNQVYAQIDKKITDEAAGEIIWRVSEIIDTLSVWRSWALTNPTSLDLVAGLYGARLQWPGPALIVGHTPQSAVDQWWGCS